MNYKFAFQSMTWIMNHSMIIEVWTIQIPNYFIIQISFILMSSLSILVWMYNCLTLMQWQQYCQFIFELFLNFFRKCNLTNFRYNLFYFTSSVLRGFLSRIFFHKIYISRKLIFENEICRIKFVFLMWHINRARAWNTLDEFKLECHAIPVMYSCYFFTA